MPSVTISTRLDPQEVKLLESLAELSGFDRSTLIKSLLRRGMKELRFEQACEVFRKDAATMSRAAEIAGLSIWEFIARMKEQGLELHYGVEDFDHDIEQFTEPS